MLFTAFIELAGVGSLFPFIKILGTPSYIHSNSILNSVYRFFGFTANDQFFILVGSAIFVMILLKAGISTLNNYLQAKLTYRINNRLSSFCLKSFLKMPYEQTIDQNSSVLSKHLLVDVAGVAAVLQALLMLMTDVVVALTLIGLMLWIDPTLILSVVIILGGLLYFMNHVTKNRISKLSVANEYYNRHAYRCATEALTSLKDAKIYHVDSYFLKRFLKWQYQLSDQMIEFSVVSNLPTNILNVMGFGVLLIILLYLIITHGNLIAILPTIGLIAISVQRLLPSASRISTSIANIRRYKPLVYVVRDVVSQFSGNTQTDHVESDSSGDLHFENALQLSNVSYRYPKSENNALENVSIHIPKNTSFAIVGESGAGKSTLVDILLGLLKINSGSIKCDAKEITNDSFCSLSRLVGYVPQQVSLLDASIKENIAFGIDPEDIDDASLEKAIAISQLKSLIDQLPDGVDTMIGEKGAKLSGGQRQRIGIARALYRDPDILIMDEATNALDAATEKEFNAALKTLMGKKTLIIIAHRLSSVQMCDSIVQLEHGKVIAEGSYQDLLNHSDSFRRIYNVSDAATT